MTCIHTIANSNTVGLILEQKITCSVVVIHVSFGSYLESCGSRVNKKQLAAEHSE